MQQVFLHKVCSFNVVRVCNPEGRVQGQVAESGCRTGRALPQSSCQTFELDGGTSGSASHSGVARVPAICWTTFGTTQRGSTARHRLGPVSFTSEQKSPQHTCCLRASTSSRIVRQAVRDVFRSDEHKQAWPIVLPSLFAMPALDNVWRFFFLSCTVEA